MGASELLDKVNNAIAAVMAGQAYQIGERQLTRADLGELRSFRRELLNEVEMTSNGGGQMASLGQIDRPV